VYSIGFFNKTLSYHKNLWPQLPILKAGDPDIAAAIERIVYPVDSEKERKGRGIGYAHTSGCIAEVIGRIVIVQFDPYTTAAGAHAVIISGHLGIGHICVSFSAAAGGRHRE
jgi:hypothetical protein